MELTTEIQLLLPVVSYRNINFKYSDPPDLDYQENEANVKSNLIHYVLLINQAVLPLALIDDVGEH